MATFILKKHADFADTKALIKETYGLTSAKPHDAMIGFVEIETEKPVPADEAEFLGLRLAMA